jgi:hypothetical protein
MQVSQSFDIASDAVRDMLAALYHGGGVKSAQEVYNAACRKHSFDDMTQRVILSRFRRASNLLLKEVK